MHSLSERLRGRQSVHTSSWWFRCVLTWENPGLESSAGRSFGSSQSFAVASHAEINLIQLFHTCLYL